MITTGFRETKAIGDLQTLRRLHGIIENRPLEFKEQLWDLLQTVFNDGVLDRNQLASDMGYNITSVSRWIEGKTAPHKSIWPSLVEWIKSALDKKIDQVEDLSMLSILPKRQHN